MWPHCANSLHNKNKEKENADNANGENKFTFATQHGAHSRSACKWIMDSEATKHMTLHMMIFDTYEVISPCNMCLGDDSMAEAIGMGFIVVGV